MKRFINFNAIGETASKLLQLINNLKDEQKQLLTDIDKLEKCYQGKDAEIIITKYKTRTSNISGYIEYLEEYQKYFNYIAGSYKNSYDKAKKDIDYELEKALNDNDKEALEENIKKLDTKWTIDNIKKNKNKNKGFLK